MNRLRCALIALVLGAFAALAFAGPASADTPTTWSDTNGDSYTSVVVLQPGQTITLPTTSDGHALAAVPVFSGYPADPTWQPWPSNVDTSKLPYALVNDLYNTGCGGCGPGVQNGAASYSSWTSPADAGGPVTWELVDTGPLYQGAIAHDDRQYQPTADFSGGDALVAAVNSGGSSGSSSGGGGQVSAVGAVIDHASDIRGYLLAAIGLVLGIAVVVYALRRGWRFVRGSI